MLVRRALLGVLALLVFAAPARAADPLLSGYAGPGGGEQSLLGDQLVPSGGGGERSLEAADPQRPAPDADAASSSQATSAASAPTDASPEPGAATPKRRADGESTSSAGVERGSASATVTYPAKSATAADGSWSTSALVIAFVVALLAFLALAVGTGRLARPHAA